MSRQSLPPAEEVEEAPYELRSIRRGIQPCRQHTLLASVTALTCSS